MHPIRRSATAAICRLAVPAMLAWSLSTAPALAWLPESVRVGRIGITYEGLNVQLRGIEIERREGAATALSIERIDGPLGLVPLWASLRLRPALAGWSLGGVVASGPGDVVLRVSGTGLGGESGRLTVTSDPVRFVPGGLQPARIWAALGRAARGVSGEIGLEAEWRFGNDAGSSGRLVANGLAFQTDFGPVARLDGRIELDRLLPPRTAEPQTVSFAGLSLAPLVGGFEIAALSADGTIDGRVTFSLAEDGRVLIDDGLLQARGPGVLRYRPAEPPAALARQGESVQLLLAALADFRYEKLDATFSGDVAGDVSVQLRLRGANPDLYEGYPIELNLNLDAPILPLVGTGRRIFELPEAVRRAMDR